MIHGVTPTADPRSESMRKGESLGASAPKPRASNSERHEQSVAKAPLDRATIEKAAGRVLEMLDAIDPRLRIEVDDETERVVVKVVEKESGEVIRQIPPEELLELEKYLSNVKGLLLQEQA